MDWRQYDWSAIAAGVFAHATTVAVLSWGIDPRVGFPAGPLVGGAVTGVLARPNLLELKNGFVTGAIGLSGTLLVFFAYWAVTTQSWIAVYLGVIYVAGSVLVGGGLAAVAAGASSAVAQLVTEARTESEYGW